MTQSQPPITGTTHTLPFDKLSPRDFERLCLWLVEREGYERAEHLGAAGSEQGRDIVAWREGHMWAFQCKRVQRFGPKSALAEVEKVLALPEDEWPVRLVFLVTCDVSDKTRKQVRKRCVGEMECHFWAGTELDEKVKRHSDIVAEFFQYGGTTPVSAADQRRIAHLSSEGYARVAVKDYYGAREFFHRALELAPNDKQLQEAIRESERIINVISAVLDTLKVTASDCMTPEEVYQTIARGGELLPPEKFVEFVGKFSNAFRQECVAKLRIFLHRAAPSLARGNFEEAIAIYREALQQWETYLDAEPDDLPELEQELKKVESKTQVLMYARDAYAPLEPLLLQAESAIDSNDWAEAYGKCQDILAKIQTLPPEIRKVFGVQSDIDGDLHTLGIIQRVKNMMMYSQGKAEAESKGF
jgi:tetratricopeptide (TPR) repeat protein